MTIFATIDNEGAFINENADIIAFETIEAAREYLLRSYDATEWDRETATIEAAEIGDCWVRFWSEPTSEQLEEVARKNGMKADDLHIDRPGQHPGGKVWWVSPRVEVLVVSAITPKDDE